MSPGPGRDRRGAGWERPPLPPGALGACPFRGREMGGAKRALASPEYPARLPPPAPAPARLLHTRPAPRKLSRGQASSAPPRSGPRPRPHRGPACSAERALAPARRSSFRPRTAPLAPALTQAGPGRRAADPLSSRRLTPPAAPDKAFHLHTPEHFPSPATSPGSTLRCSRSAFP